MYKIMNADADTSLIKDIVCFENFLDCSVIFSVVDF